MKIGVIFMSVLAMLLFWRPAAAADAVCVYVDFPALDGGADFQIFRENMQTVGKVSRILRHGEGQCLPIPKHEILDGERFRVAFRLPTCNRAVRFMCSGWNLCGPEDEVDAQRREQNRVRRDDGKHSAKTDLRDPAGRPAGHGLMTQKTDHLRKNFLVTRVGCFPVQF